MHNTCLFLHSLCYKSGTWEVLFGRKTDKITRESCVITKMTARCALYMDALKNFGSFWLQSTAHDGRDEQCDEQVRLQNTLARVVSNTRRRDHITPVLADLHWLPVRCRIEYKLALIMFKALTTHQPQYLSELIHLYEVPRQLRSRGVNILQNTAVFPGVLSATPHLQSGTIFLKVSFLI